MIFKDGSQLTLNKSNGIGSVKMPINTKFESK